MRTTLALVKDEHQDKKVGENKGSIHPLCSKNDKAECEGAPNDNNQLIADAA